MKQYTPEIYEFLKTIDVFENIYFGYELKIKNNKNNNYNNTYLMYINRNSTNICLKNILFKDNFDVRLLIKIV